MPAGVNIILVLAGFFLIWIALRDVFLSVVLPQAADRRLRLSAILARSLWRLWRLAAKSYSNEDRRESFLGMFAPFTLMTQLALWVAVLIWGFGTLLYGLPNALQPHSISYTNALYFAGASLLTIGYGDITPASEWARVISLAAGASGLAVVALTASFLFSIFGAFRRRESFVATLGARAGSPPSGVGLLAIAGYLNLCEDLNVVFRQGQAWTAELMESHLAYPILAHYRSSHDYESWVTTLGTLLDAATLVITTVDRSASPERFDASGQARILFNIGRHAAHDLTHYYGLPLDDIVGLQPAEFEHACDRLSTAGFTIRDRAVAWESFCDLRKGYAGHLNALARWLAVPPLRWTGDNVLIEAAHLRGQLSERLLRRLSGFDEEF
ncbi:MAG TPA: potassium channel family protein [Candidatus Cybelea sp.]|nr:potassium channel family protein [Candidatus Cybelea sp.]